MMQANDNIKYLDSSHINKPSDALDSKNITIELNPISTEPYDQVTIELNSISTEHHDQVTIDLSSISTEPHDRVTMIDGRTENKKKYNRSTHRCDKLINIFIFTIVTISSIVIIGAIITYFVVIF